MNKIYTHEEFAYQWEAREHQIRQDILVMRKRQDRQIELQRQRIIQFDKTIHEQQRTILRIRSIPLIGGYLVRWAESNPSPQPKGY